MTRGWWAGVVVVTWVALAAVLAPVGGKLPEVTNDENVTPLWSDI